MSIVNIIRHSIKGVDGNLSEEGKAAALEYGKKLAEEYEGYKIVALAADVGRCEETANLINEGASSHYEGDVLDDRLTQHYSDETRNEIIAVKKANGDKTFLDAALEVAEDGFYANATGLAKFADEYCVGDEDTVYVGVSQSPKVEGLGYIISGEDEAADQDTEPLSGITVEDGKVTLDYANGEVIECESLVEACENAQSCDYHGSGADQGDEGAEAGEAAE